MAWWSFIFTVSHEDIATTTYDGICTEPSASGGPCQTAAVAELGAVATFADVRRDVPRPDLVFLLSVPEEERRRRLGGRGDGRTAEENRLQNDDAFRRRVLDDYAALGARSVDATGAVETIVPLILEHIEAWRVRALSSA